MGVRNRVVDEVLVARRHDALVEHARLEDELLEGREPNLIVVTPVVIGGVVHAPSLEGCKGLREGLDPSPPGEMSRLAQLDRDREGLRLPRRAEDR